MSFDFENANEAQKKAIAQTEGPVLIIAGPGTGKTFTLVKRVVYLVTEKGVKPEEIMVATFTEKAAKELVTRITNELLRIKGKKSKINVNEMYVGTFHSICLRILKEYSEYTRIKKNYRMVDELEQKYIIVQHINEFRKLPSFDTLFTSGGAFVQAEEIAKCVNGLLEELLDIETMCKDDDPQIVAAAHVMKTYQDLLEKQNLLDFTSIQTETYTLFHNYPGILEKIRNKIKYVMVDEYQDTNYIQEQITFLIAGEKKNICVVGDDDQGLYRFRGATIRNILEFPSHFEEGECEQIYLKNNYRSEKEIIDFYNDWMQNPNGFDWGKFRFYKNIEPAKEGYSSKTSVIRCSGDKQEDWGPNVYRLITSLKSNNNISDYNQVAFICASVKNKKIQSVINYLEGHGVPVYAPRSEMFFDRREIRELIGLLVLLFPNYYDKLLVDDFKYNGKSHKALYYYYREECVPLAQELLEKNSDLKKWYEEKSEKHKALADNTDYGFKGLLYQMLQFKPFHEYLDIGLGTGVQDERVVRNISILLSIIEKYEYLEKVEIFTKEKIDDSVKKFFNKFLKFIKEGGINEFEDESEYAPKGCVSFMTVHQSKGLEFPVVMVASLTYSPGDEKRWKSNMDGFIEEVVKQYSKRKPFEDDKIVYYDFWRKYYTAFSRAQNLLVLTSYERGEGGKGVIKKIFADKYYSLPNYDEINLSHIKADEIKPVNIKQTYSFTSHIALYENCSKQYKFFKELGFKQDRVGATVFGTLVHETIEDIHRAAMRHEESKITRENVRLWFDSNYESIKQSEHKYLGDKQKDAAYEQVWSYVERVQREATRMNKSEPWKHIQEAEVEISLPQPKYILTGNVDLIQGEGDSVEIVDFKSEQKPDFEDYEYKERYQKQLEVYAYLVEEKTGRTVSKMHLYYTGESGGNPMVTFEKSRDSIDATKKQFDDVVKKIENHDYSTGARDKKLCENCDMRYYCGKVKMKGR